MQAALSSLHSFAADNDWQEQRRQYRDDRNHDEQFDQGEGEPEGLERGNASASQGDWGRAVFFSHVRRSSSNVTEGREFSAITKVTHRHFPQRGR